MDTFQERLSLLIGKARGQQAAFAKKTGISTARISKLLRGKSEEPKPYDEFYSKVRDRLGHEAEHYLRKGGPLPKISLRTEPMPIHDDSYEALEMALRDLTDDQLHQLIKTYITSFRAPAARKVMEIWIGRVEARLPKE